MSAAHVNFIRSKHEYTRADVPWELEEYHSAYGKLIHYLSGGGMSTFGRTIKQEVAHRKHCRFMVVVGVLAVLWSIFYYL